MEGRKTEREGKSERGMEGRSIREWDKRREKGRTEGAKAGGFAFPLTNLSEGGFGISVFAPEEWMFRICSVYSRSCCSAKVLKLSTMIPALLQSYT